MLMIFVVLETKPRRSLDASKYRFDIPFASSSGTVRIQGTISPFGSTLLNRSFNDDDGLSFISLQGVLSDVQDKGMQKLQEQSAPSPTG